MEKLPNLRRTALVLGFSGSGKAGDHHTNPTGRIAEYLNGRYIQGRYVEGISIPSTSSLRDRPELIGSIMRAHRRHAVIHFGVANINWFEIETQGRNLINTTAYPDYWEGPIVDEALIPGAPPVYHNSSHRLDWIASEMNERGFPTVISNDSGKVGCNASNYSLLHHRDDYPVIFAHTPMTREFLQDAHLQPSKEVYYRPEEWILKGAQLLVDLSLRSIKAVRYIHCG